MAKTYRVSKVEGEAFVRRADGTMDPLAEGMEIHEGDTIISNGGVSLEGPDGHTIDLDAGTALAGDPEGDGPQLTGTPFAGGSEGSPGSGAPSTQAEGYGFFYLPRTDYLQDSRFFDMGNLGKDVNDTFLFLGRHTFNPRIQYFTGINAREYPDDEWRELWRPWGEDEGRGGRDWGDGGRPGSREEIPLPEPPQGPDNQPPACPSRPQFRRLPLRHLQPPATPDKNSIHQDDGSPVTGNVLINDSDPDGDKLTVVGVGKTPNPSGNVGTPVGGKYGEIVINPDGSYTYTPDTNKTKSVGEGETGKDTFTYTITDGNGGTSTTTVTIEIEGKNDGPTANPDENEVTEDDGTTATGNVITGGSSGDEADSDPDENDTLTVVGIVHGNADPGQSGIANNTEIEGDWGKLVINPDGSYTYELDNEKAQKLSNEQTEEDVFTYKISDGNGGYDTTTLTIKVHGTNDPPVANPDENEVTEDGGTTATGNVIKDGSSGDEADSDPDENDTLTVVGIAKNDGTPYEEVGVGGTEIEGDWGTLKINPDGTYTYELDNDKAQKLSGGQTEDDVFTYKISDGKGGYDTTTLTIKAHGTNDPPVANPDENYVALGVNDDAKGNVITGLSEKDKADIDPDENDTLTVIGVKSGGGSPVTDGTGVGSAVPGAYGTVVINPDGSYTYIPDLGNDYVKALERGDQLVDEFTYAIQDSHGEESHTTLKITITWPNKVPVPVADTNEVTEDSVTTTTGNVIGPEGTLPPSPGDKTDTDPDVGEDGEPLDTLTVVGVEKGNIDKNLIDPDSTVGEEISGEYGTVNISPDGSYTYTLDNTKAEVQALAVGETLTDTFTYTVDDGHDGYAHTTLTITINGANDAPVIKVLAGDKDSAELTENAQPLTVIGTLTPYDVDTTDTVTGSKVDNVTWGYSGDRPAGLTNEKLLEMFTVGGPGEPSESAQENPHGITWTFNSNIGGLDGPLKAFDFLAEGETLTLTYTVRATDSQGAYVDHPVTITITGTNDAPVANPDTNVVTEDGPDQSGHDDSNLNTTIIAGDVIKGDGLGGVADTDPDNGETAGLTVVGVAAGDTTVDLKDPSTVDQVVTGTYGTVTINSDGTYTYELDNNKAEVQALGLNDTPDDLLTDTFTYTVTDDQGATATTTLTITINGANDAPEIYLEGTDSDFAPLNDETVVSGAEGTLSLRDVDTNDEVTTSVLKVIPEGYAGYNLPEGLESQLRDMLTVSGGLAKDETDEAHRIKWGFTADEGTFNFIPTGESLDLVYTIQVDDHNGGTNTHDVTITITGKDQVGSLGSGVTAFLEEDVVGGKPGKVLSPHISGYKDDPDDGETVVITKFTIDGMGGEFTPGSSYVDVKNSEGETIGTFKLELDGSYTFKPTPNYSGPVPEITYYAKSGKEGSWEPIGSAKLTLTVKPVSDAPDITVADVETPEDTPVSLGLKIPEIKDKTDLTGSTDDHDNPERLGTIKLSGFPDGSKLYYLDGEGKEVVIPLPPSGPVKIMLTDIAGYHTATTGSTSGVIEMTQAEYESLKILPPADRHENITITVEATSYEVNKDGNVLDGVAGAKTIETFKVDVLAVTDDVKLYVKVEDNLHDAQTAEHAVSLDVDEDNVLNLKDYLEADFKDTDGSEQRWITIKVPGSGNDPSLFINGTEYKAGATATIAHNASGNNLSTSTTGFPDINIKGGKDFSGEINGIKVTLHAQDTDSDSPDASPAEESDSVFLNLRVAPVAGEVTTAITASGTEDQGRFLSGQTYDKSGIKFLENLALTDTDGSEEIIKIELKADNVPDGWTIYDQNGDKVTFDGEGKASILVGEYKNYTAVPPAHVSGKGIKISVDVVTKDSANIDGHPVTVTSEPVKVTVSIDVTPQAEALKFEDGKWVTQDTDKDGSPDFTMTEGHRYTGNEGTEDEAFIIDADGFTFKAGWTNQDTNEETYALLTPLIWNKDEGKSGDFVVAKGSVFTWDGGGRAAFDGVNPVEIPKDAFDKNIQFNPPPNMAGEFKIKVEAKTVDWGDDGQFPANEAISGEAFLEWVIVNPVADKVTVAISQAVGKEDEPIDLDIRPSSDDPNETFNVTISGIPNGAIIKYGNEDLLVEGGEVTIDNYEPGKLTFQAPPNKDGTFELKVSTVAVDTVYTSEGTKLESVSEGDEIKTLDLEVTVIGVADRADLNPEQNLTITEAEAEAGEITLDKIITNKVEPLDEDGSEKASLVIKGLQKGFNLEGDGVTFLGGTGDGRQWAVDPAKLSDVKITVPQNFNGKIPLEVRAITTEEHSGDAHEGVWKEVTVTVTPTPEAEMNLSTSGKEDTKVDLDFSVIHKGGDTDEFISEVWISKEDIDSKGITLYKDETLLTSDNGWYKIAEADLEKIQAQGPANEDGEFTFEVKYFVTDPGKDGNADVKSEGIDDIYTLTLAPVTDATKTAVSKFDVEVGIAEADGTSGVKITGVDESNKATFEVKIDVTQLPDPKAGGAADTDGSEELLYFVVDNVPYGVSIEGGTYVGMGTDSTEQYPVGKWVVKVDENFKFDTATLTPTLKFTLDNSGGIFQGQNHDYAIKVTAYSRDGEMSDMEKSETTWTLTTNIEGEGGQGTYVPPEFTVEKITPTVNEDKVITLDQLLKVDVIEEATGSGARYSVIISGLDPDVRVEGMIMTENKEGEPVWTASVAGKDHVQSLLESIKFHLPENWNDNNDGKNFHFNATVNGYTVSSDPNNDETFTSDTVKDIDPIITPVTDPAIVEMTIPTVDEDNNVPITIKLSNPADGDNANIVGGKVYLQIEGEGEGEGKDVLKYGEDELTKETVSDVEGIPYGKYYVIEVVGATGTIDLTYTPKEHASGGYTLKVWTVSQETGASNEVVTEVGETFTINPVNSEYDLTIVGGQAVGNEDEKILIDLTGSGLADGDGSEKVVSATLTKVPKDFIVYVGDAMAQNTGSGTWAIPLDPLDGGKLPDNIYIKAPENWSGVKTGIELNVYTSDSGLSPTATTEKFDLIVNPVADKITIDPTQTFGPAGERIAINLNAAMVDTDGSEKATVELTGLGQYADFEDEGGTRLSFEYDEGTDTYTITGITVDQLKTFYVVQGAMTKTPITVKAWTVDTAKGLDGEGNLIDVTSSPSDETAEKTFNITISPKGGTSGSDTLLYYTGATIDGKGGTDTLLLRYGETIDFGVDNPASKIKNFEIIDMSGNGEQKLLNLTPEDVKAMTDSNNTLKIDGDVNDKVTLGAGWTRGEDNGGYAVYTDDDGTFLKVRLGIDIDSPDVNADGTGTMGFMAPMGASFGEGFDAPWDGHHDGAAATGFLDGDGSESSYDGPGDYDSSGDTPDFGDPSGPDLPEEGISGADGLFGDAMDDTGSTWYDGSDTELYDGDGAAGDSLGDPSGEEGTYGYGPDSGSEYDQSSDDPWSEGEDSWSDPSEAFDSDDTSAEIGDDGQGQSYDSGGDDGLASGQDPSGEDGASPFAPGEVGAEEGDSGADSDDFSSDFDDGLGDISADDVFDDGGDFLFDSPGGEDVPFHDGGDDGGYVPADAALEVIDDLMSA